MEEKNSEKKERKMRDSGIPWIGEVPDGWECIKGKFIFTQRNERGNTKNLTLLSPTQKYGVIPQDLYEQKTGMNAVKLNEKTNLSLLKTIHAGDYCISLRSFQGGFEYSEYEGVVSPAYQVFYAIKDIEQRFYKYLFKDESFIYKMNSFTMSLRDGKNIAFSDFGNTEIPVPLISEQHRIADFLDSKCSKIDTLIENLRARVESAKEYKKAVITEAVTKGLDKDAKMKDSGVEWIGEVPEGWKIVQFKHIASIKSNLVQPDKYMKYPQIAPDNIEKDTGRLLSHQTVEESGIISGNHLFYRGQILYSKIRPNLNKLTVAPFDGLCSADMYPIESKLPTLFMVYSMLSTYFVSQVSLIIQDRVKMPKINQEELGEIKVVVPSQQEMLTIADYLDSKCSEIDALLQNYEDQITTLEEYKKSLIYEYVTGKKEVPAA